MLHPKIRIKLGSGELWSGLGLDINSVTMWVRTLVVIDKACLLPTWLYELAFYRLPIPISRLRDQVVQAFDVAPFPALPSTYLFRHLPFIQLLNTFCVPRIRPPQKGIENFPRWPRFFQLEETQSSTEESIWDIWARCSSQPILGMFRIWFWREWRDDDSIFSTEYWVVTNIWSNIVRLWRNPINRAKHPTRFRCRGVWRRVKVWLGEFQDSATF